MCLGLDIHPRFERAKMYDSHGHENKISSTNIINNDGCVGYFIFMTI